MEEKMPTPQAKARLDPDLLGAARCALDLPPDAPASEVIRVALERLAGAEPGSTRKKGGRPPKVRAGP